MDSEGIRIGVNKCILPAVFLMKLNHKMTYKIGQWTTFALLKFRRGFRAIY